MSDLQMSKALDEEIKAMHPNLPEPARANIAKAEYPIFRKGWVARGVADQLPDHAAPAAELEPEQVGEPAPHLLPMGWTPGIEALYTAMMKASPDVRREAFKQAVARAARSFEERADL